MRKPYLIIRQSNGTKYLVHLARTDNSKQGYTKIKSLGTEEKLQEFHKDYLKLLRSKLTEIKPETPEQEILVILHSYLKNLKVERTVVNIGIDYFYKHLRELDLFSAFKKTKHKDIEKIYEYLIAKRIISNSSMIENFNKKELYETEITAKKDSFYSFLDVLADSKIDIIKKLNKVLLEKTKRQEEYVFYDSSTVYFETFSREGLRCPGYSKDGKFKEDQVVLGMATDANGIPIYYKLFKGNTSDPLTLKPFILELTNIFNIKNITIISDKGMSTNSNIRFLEQKRINFIISYRLKTSSKRFKEYVLNKEGYAKSRNGNVYKEFEYESHWKQKRLNETMRRKIIVYSKSRAKKDREDREILINNFIKKANGKPTINSSDLVSGKKYRFFKQINKSEYELDFEKIKEDSKFDGYYIYETSRFDLKVDEVIDIYHQQWNIEENFRALKSNLRVRPVYVTKDKHIEGHFLMCFLSLVVLKYMIFKINNYLSGLGLVEKITYKKLLDCLNLLTKNVEKIDGKLTNSYENDLPDIKNLRPLWELIKPALLK